MLAGWLLPCRLLLLICWPMAWMFVFASAGTLPQPPCGVRCGPTCRKVCASIQWPVVRQRYEVTERRDVPLNSESLQLYL
jgi:hypothetical protein